MSFPNGTPPTTVRVHPTQLYESAASLVIFAILLWVIAPRFKREGPLIFAYAILAGIERFLVEFIRTNKPVLLGLTQQQWIAIAMIIVGIVFTWFFATRGRLRPVVEPGGVPAKAAVAVAGKAGSARPVAKKVAPAKATAKAGSGARKK
jgi:phosphatidylglycerol:prolipoprotein diacylglycerol transferase